MIKNIIAKRYSLALVEAFPNKELKTLEKEVDFFMEFLQNNPEIEEFLLSPAVEDKDRKDILDKMAEGLKISKEFHNFLKILIDKDRIYFLQDIYQEIIKQLHQRLNIQDFEMITAHKVDSKTIEKIRNFVGQYVPGEVHFNVRIDKRIRGGFVVYNENLDLDASIKNNLTNIRRKF